MSTNEHSTNTPRAQSSRDGIGFDRGYFRTLDGILKILEMIFDIVAFSCAVVWQDVPYAVTYRSAAAGWTMFVTITAVVTTLVFYVLHSCRLIYKLPGPWGLIEPICYCVHSVMLLIAGIVAAVEAERYAYLVPSITATAGNTCIAFILYCVNTFLLFICWCRSVTAAGGTVTRATGTSTTKQTTHEAQRQS